MRINDIIYFSPRLLLKDLNIDNHDLVLESFEDRITEYYLEPIKTLVECQQAFSAGALECLLIDALARYSSTENGVEARFVDWCNIYLNVDNSTATEFYKYFRCGLLHESHIKNYGQFCFDDPPADKALQKIDGYIIVNPRYLFENLEKYLGLFIKDLKSSNEKYEIFINRIENDFKDEVERAKNG